MNPTPREVLVRVRDHYLTSEAKWTKRASARSKAGTALTYNSLQMKVMGEAECYCLETACGLSAKDLSPDGSYSLYRNTLFVLSCRLQESVFLWQDRDSTTFGQIQALVNRVIDELGNKSHEVLG